MDYREFLFYGAMIIANSIITTSWAKYGITETYINFPELKKIWRAIFAGVIIFLVGGYLQKHEILELAWMKGPELYKGLLIILGIPLVWMFIYQFFYMPPGQRDYNRAIVRTKYWKAKYFSHGELLPNDQNPLANFPMAEETVELFKKAIASQEKGTAVNTYTRIIPIDYESASYHGDCQLIKCSCCPGQIAVPIHNGSGVYGICSICGSKVGAKTMADGIHVTFFSAKSHQEVTPANKHNIAVAYQELALLFRLMGRTDESKSNYQKSLDLLDKLLEQDRENLGLLETKSLVLFRLAELCQALNQDKKLVKDLYTQSLAISHSIGDHHDDHVYKEIFQMLNSGD